MMLSKVLLRRGALERRETQMAFLIQSQQQPYDSIAQSALPVEEQDGAGVRQSGGHDSKFIGSASGWAQKKRPVAFTTGP